MIERLYCPDFTTILGKEFRNPFDYPMIDSLVWPTLKDIELDLKGKALLELMSVDGHPLFYKRAVDIHGLLTEMKNTGLIGSCIQAIDINENYGVSSEIVLDYCEKYNSMLYPILSPLCSKKGVEKFKINAKKAIAAVIYPTFQKINLSSPSLELQEIIKICISEDIPLKIDLGNMYLPENDPTFVSPDKLRHFIHKNPKLKCILSGIDMLGNGGEVLNIMRYERNAFVEFDPRTFGGTTPRKFFSLVFNTPGFIQYGWCKFLLGSSTPMLESSQVTRGFWNASEDLNFTQQSLLRAWMYRNIHRIYKMPFSLKGFDLLQIYKKGVQDLSENPRWDNRSTIELSDGNIFIKEDLIMDSFSITQLLHVQPLLDAEVSSLLDKHCGYEFGEVTIKSPHTTTSLIINEHEHGNFLQLHYSLCEETMLAAEDKLHTTPALENRADFNYPDHIVASSFGQRSLSIPILNKVLQKGGRENIYALVTFGPRAIKLNLTVKFFKGKEI